MAYPRRLGDNQANGGREEANWCPEPTVLTSEGLATGGVTIGEARGGSWDRPRGCQFPHPWRRYEVLLFSTIALWESGNDQDYPIGDTSTGGTFTLSFILDQRRWRGEGGRERESKSDTYAEDHDGAHAAVILLR